MKSVYSAVRSQRFVFKGLISSFTLSTHIIYLIILITSGESEPFEILNFNFLSSLVFIIFFWEGVEFFPSTPCSQVLSICAVAYLMSAYKLLYFTVGLELFLLMCTPS
jgi:hypothetical protein